MLLSKRRLTGTCLSASEFRVHETTKTLEVGAILDVLGGNLAAYRVRGFVPTDACRKIVQNFWASPAKVARPGYGDNGVEAFFVGASHIGKTTKEYLDDCSASGQAVSDLYKGTVNPAALFRATFASAAYLEVRPAQSMGRAAGDAKAVYWNNSSEFLLEPHEDFAQTKDPEQRGFEIQAAQRVMALNIYAAVPPNSGQLQIWNIEPDGRSRAKLGLTYSGFPYPPELLTEFPSQTIPVETGDVCVINGNLVHGVLRGDSAASPEKRLLITCFMMRTHNDEVIWWT